MQHRNRPLLAERGLGTQPDPKAQIACNLPPLTMEDGAGRVSLIAPRRAPPPSPTERGTGGRANQICHIHMYRTRRAASYIRVR